MIDEIARRRHAARRPPAGAVRRPLRRRAAGRRGDLDRGRPAARPGRAARRSLGAQLDLVPLAISPPSFVPLREPRRDPDDGAARGPARRGVDGGRPRRLVAVDTSTADPTLHRRRRPRARPTPTCRPGVVHLGTPLDGGWQLGGRRRQRSTGGTGFGVVDAPTTSATAGSARCGYAQPLGADALADPAGRAVGGRAGRRQPGAVPARFRRQMAGDETLIDLDAEPGAAAAVSDRTGVGGRPATDEAFAGLGRRAVRRGGSGV